MANNMNTPITHRPELEKKYKPLFIILSIVIPVVVAVLFRSADAHTQRRATCR